MLKDIRLHGSVTPEIDFFATLAGEKLLTSHFYELTQGEKGLEASFFLFGMYLRITPEGLHFSGTGGIVSEYMFGSPMPVEDLGHKEVRNRLVLFGARGGEEGIEFTPHVEGFERFNALFMEGNAISNTFFLVWVPWPYSTRRTQEVLLKTLGKVMKRSEHTSMGADSDLLGQLLRELAEPDAVVLILRLTHLPHLQFHDFVEDFYQKKGQWGEEQERFASVLAEEIGVTQYQRERIAIDILYKDPRNRQIVDEYKDILLKSMGSNLDPSSKARLNSLRNLALRHNLPLSLFNTLDKLAPAGPLAVAEMEPEYLHQTREIFEGLFLASKPSREVIGPEEIARLLQNKQVAQQQRDNGFEQLLLDTGRMLDEKMAESEDFEAFEVFSEVVTYFDRLDNALAVVNQLAFMEHAHAPEEKVRSLLGNKRAFDEMEEGLFYTLIIQPALQNDYALKYGKRKVMSLYAGLERLERGEQTIQEISDQIETLTREERVHDLMYGAIRSRLKQFYFNLSNPAHLRVLQKEVEGELRKIGALDGAAPSGSFDQALEEIQRETEYVNNLLPRIVETNDDVLREEFLKNSGLDRYRLEDLERQYREAHGLLPAEMALEI